jgi:hypothetical protein
MPDPMTCVHRESGLCDDCRADADEDFPAWLEYGRHSEGDRRWRELQAELAARPAEPAAAADDSDVPY